MRATYINVQGLNVSERYPTKKPNMKCQTSAVRGRAFLTAGSRHEEGGFISGGNRGGGIDGRWGNPTLKEDMGSAEGGGKTGSSNIIRSKPADPGSPSPSHGLVSTLCATENRPWLLIVLGLAVIKESPCCALRLSGTGRRSRRGGGIGRDFSTLSSYCTSEDNGVEIVIVLDESRETERVRLELVSPRSAVDLIVSRVDSKGASRKVPFSTWVPRVFRTVRRRFSNHQKNTRSSTTTANTATIIPTINPAELESGFLETVALPVLTPCGFLDLLGLGVLVKSEPAPWAASRCAGADGRVVIVVLSEFSMGVYAPVGCMNASDDVCKEIV